MIKPQLLSLCLFSIFYFTSFSVYAQCHGGMVETSDGDTEVYACIADNDADYIGFSNNSLSDANYVYLLTDEANQVLAIPEDNFTDFNGLSLGTCRAWGLSYTGNLMVSPGDFLEEAIMLSDDCFDLSTNFITIYRVLREPSQLTTMTGEAIVEINSNANAVVQYDNTPTLAGSYQYVILREDGKIIGLDESGQFDFSTFAEGKYLIWGYAYYGEFLLEIGDFLDGEIATACITKSDNFILVKKNVGTSIIGCRVDGARVKTTDGATTAYACVGDDDGDYVGFVNTSIVNANYVYLITNENDEILALVEDNFANFEGVAPGICRVWGLSYEGDFIGQLGDNVGLNNLATSCFDRSDNFITIDRSMMEETSVRTVDDETTLTIEDNLLAAFNFSNSGSGASDYRYFIANDDQQIIGISADGYFDFAPFDQGKYFVWGYTFSGDLLLDLGDDLEGAIST
ncbi:MAG: hypothetical protein AAF985_13525, partial [Bacteroidota bacterium]